jgi:citrate lyase gamma subunit
MMWHSVLRRLFPWFRVPLPIIPSTRFIATIWKKSHLSEGWVEKISAFDAASIKVVDRGNLHEIDAARQIAGSVRGAGIQVHAWGFHDCADWNGAVREARTAAKAVRDINASAYHWNAEREWSESSNPPWFAMVFAREFKSVLPDVTLFANCFRSPVDAEMISVFDQFEWGPSLVKTC